MIALAAAPSTVRGDSAIWGFRARGDRNVPSRGFWLTVRQLNHLLWVAEARIFVLSDPLTPPRRFLKQI